MKDKSAIYQEIDELKEEIHLRETCFNDNDCTLGVLKKYKNLLSILCEWEEEAHNRAAKPMADPWHLGYWKAIDHILMKVEES